MREQDSLLCRYLNMFDFYSSLFQAPLENPFIWHLKIPFFGLHFDFPFFVLQDALKNFLGLKTALIPAGQLILQPLLFFLVIYVPTHNSHIFVRPKRCDYLDDE